jgi:hypothetical protein
VTKTGCRHPEQIAGLDLLDATKPYRSAAAGSAAEALRNDHAAFSAVRVDAELGTITWRNGADLSPQMLSPGRAGVRPLPPL